MDVKIRAVFGAQPPICYIKNESEIIQIIHTNTSKEAKKLLDLFLLDPPLD